MHKICAHSKYLDRKTAVSAFPFGRQIYDACIYEINYLGQH